jgi:hypothetical protein
MEAHPTPFSAHSTSSSRPKFLDSITAPANNFQRDRLLFFSATRGIRALKTRAQEIRRTCLMFLAGLVAANKTRWRLMSFKTPDSKP